ncbi:MAG TPA: alpha/beta hydrolase [Burkholderiales bacterium]|nr:alpha/beta hydrolase [Burkholderiales bacterium]
MIDRIRIRLLLAACALFLSVTALAQTASTDQEPIGIGLEGFAYPYPVQYLLLRMEGEDVKMAFMDVEPAATPNGKTVVLMHGRNFYSAYWKDTIHLLSARGYRVIAPDQIGFGKSSKPDVPHSLHVHAYNTKQLLDYLGVKRAIFVGHSLGGMMAARFALMYPEQVERLVLEDPIGLEDYRLKVPFATRDELTSEARKQTRAAIDTFMKGFFANWKPEFQSYADVQYRWMLGPESELVARTAAQTYTMAYEQPVLYELPSIKTPTLLIVGDKDRAAIGRARVSPEVRATLGLYPELAKKAAQSMPDCKLVLVPDVGHVPQLEAPDAFHDELLRFIEAK